MNTLYKKLENLYDENAKCSEISPVHTNRLILFLLQTNIDETEKRNLMRDYFNDELSVSFLANKVLANW